MADDKSTHTGAGRAIDKAQDAVGAAVGKTSASLGGGSTGAFVKNAALGDMYEIKAAEVALRRARDPKVRSLAEEMIADHKQASANLKVMVQSLGDVDNPPEELDARRKGMIENLEKAPDGDFDKSYLEQQAAAHEEATTLFRNYGDNGDNPQLKGLAIETLPVLERHFQHVRELQKAF